MRTLENIRIWISDKRDGLQLMAALVGMVALLPSAFLFFWEAPTRRQAAVQGSWEVVSRMEGKSAAGGRVSALAHLRRAGEPLAGIVLSNAVMSGVDLRGVDLSASRFDGVRFESCIFADSVMSNVILTGGRFDYKCDFTRASITNGRFEDASFVDSGFAGARLRQISGNARTSFNGATLAGATLSNSALGGAAFDGVDFTDAKVVQSQFDGVSFRKAKLDGILMSGVSAQGGDFSGATGAKLLFNDGSDLDGARFDSTRFIAPVFERVSMRGLRSFGASWVRAQFRSCDLTDADFSSADLSGATVCECKGTEDAFRHARIKPSERDKCVS